MNQEEGILHSFKLKDESFRKAAEAVIGSPFESNLYKGGSYVRKLEEAQVLNIWFEPVYKKTPKVDGHMSNIWYRNINSSFLFFHISNYEGYGFMEGRWQKQRYIFFLKDFSNIYKPATKSEVLQGIKKYAVVKNLMKFHQEIESLDMIHFYVKDTQKLILSHDKWIITELPKINGYDGELDRETGHILYGCAKLNVEWFQSSINRAITQITLSSGVNINEKEIKQIRDFLVEKEVFISTVKTHKIVNPKFYGTLGSFGLEPAGEIEEREVIRRCPDGEHDFRYIQENLVMCNKCSLLKPYKDE